MLRAPPLLLAEPRSALASWRRLPWPVAVVIASDLAKDIAGEPLLRGVSFKLERRDRLTIAGRNGAGKTTLLRMLSGEASIDGGELVFSKGVRVALHDQRPPRERSITLRDYVLSARKEPLELEAELRALEERMAAGDEAAMRALRGGPGALRGARRLHVARAGQPVPARPRVRRRRPRPRAQDVLRRPADARVARACARRRARPAAARRAHQPPRHRVARVARGDADRPRRRDHARRARPLVPRGRRHGRARDGGRTDPLLQGLVDRVAQGAGRARARARPRDREAAGRDRADGGVRRALPREGDQGAPGPGPHEEAREDRTHRTRSARQPRARASSSRSPSARAGSCSSSRTGASRSPAASCSTRPSCGSSVASTCRSSGPTASARRR